MDKIELATELINRGTEMLLQESAGSHGLRRRMEIAYAEDRQKQADTAIAKLNEIKDKTRSKHKLADLDEKIGRMEGYKNSLQRDKDRSQREAEEKKTESKEAIRKYGKEAGIAKMQRKTNVDTGLAESRIKNRKSQNETISELLSETIDILNEEYRDESRGSCKMLYNGDRFIGGYYTSKERDELIEEYEKEQEQNKKEKEQEKNNDNK